ncbi:MAG: manganese efflux pump [Clostridia bacterium]|nr:manganese efflux pump [Clostridia bacterium]
MTLFELFIIAVGLSMDAFAVAICKGLAVKKAGIKQMALAGLWFGGFQGLMPFIGYLLGSTFESYITKIDHWIAFVLLGIIGANMIKEALSKEDDDCNCDGKAGSMAVKEMFTLAVATSIDALAVGVTFALLPEVNIGAAVGFIGIITFAFSAVGIKIGNIFGVKFKSKAELAGGIILILMGLKILLEHLGVINF